MRFLVFVFLVPFLALSGASEGQANLTVNCFPEVSIELDAASVTAFKNADATLILGDTETCDGATNVSGDSECDGSDAGAGKYKFELSDPSKCNAVIVTDTVTNKTTITWKISRKPTITSSAPIRRALCGCIEVSCTYDVENTVLTKTPFVVEEKQLTMVGKTETGEYDLEMNFMNDAYDAKITNFKVDINSKINVEAKVKSTFDGYKVSVVDCFANADEDPLKVDNKYEIIKSDGCEDVKPYDGANSKDVVKQKDSKAQFWFKSFVWTGLEKAKQKIFVHCTAQVCLASDMACQNTMGNTDSCTTKRRRRSVTNSKEHLVSLGPLYIENGKPTVYASNNTAVLPCNLNNGGCNEICVNNVGYKKGFMCACEPGRFLRDDGFSCMDKNLLQRINRIGSAEINDVMSEHLTNEAAIVVAAVAVITILNIIGVILIVSRKGKQLAIAQ